MATEVPAIVVDEVKDTEKCPEENLKAKVVTPNQENGSGDATATNGKNGESEEKKDDAAENGAKKETEEKEDEPENGESTEDKTATKRPAEQVEGEKETEEVKKQKTEDKVDAENGKTEEPAKATE